MGAETLAQGHVEPGMSGAASFAAEEILQGFNIAEFFKIR